MQSQDMMNKESENGAIGVVQLMGVMVPTAGDVRGVTERRIIKEKRHAFGGIRKLGKRELKHLTKHPVCCVSRVMNLARTVEFYYYVGVLTDFFKNIRKYDCGYYYDGLHCATMMQVIMYLFNMMFEKQ
ncbi:hypothetical protein ACF0H5_008152 [Mactra antiquata]